MKNSIYPVASEIQKIKRWRERERERERWRELENELSPILRLNTFCLILKVLGHLIELRSNEEMRKCLGILRCLRLH